MTTVPLGAGPEFDRIRAIAAVLGDAAAGLGDDCATLADGWRASTDLAVEGVHFRREWLAAEEIGWRAAMAALSDLAAAGASAEAILVALAVPADEPASTLTAVMRGIGEAASAVGAKVVGGDLSSGSGMAITVTVLGKAAWPIGRRGANPGDELWVTGTLGGARAAWRAWEAGQVPNPAARRRFAHPMARIAEGRLLAKGGATAMVDLSDGLGGDAGHLARASGVGLEIELRLVPIDGSVGGDQRAIEAASGGEDYELLVALPVGAGAAIAQQLLKTTGTMLTRIGQVVAGAQVRFLHQGSTVALVGFNHFR